jgi:F-type H+-transporting ATPase subunit epsilon
MAKPGSIRCVVITPEARVLDQNADSVVIPAHDGELGIEDLRAPIMCQLGTGRLRYTAGGSTHQLLVDGGFAQVNDNEVTVLTDSVCKPEDVTDALIKQTEEQLVGVTGSTDDDVADRFRLRRKLNTLRDMRSR